MWGSAMSQIKGKEDWGSYTKCCVAAGVAPPCTFYVAYKELTEHYGIKDKNWRMKPCFPVLSYFQILDTVLVREKLHMVNMYVAPDEEK